MKAFLRIASAAAFRFRGVSVCALVGRSGTGKSFRARLIAEKLGLDLIIDDGLIVRGDAIVSGRWAKKEGNLLAATRRALFDDPEHAQEVRLLLRGMHVRGVLIVGTTVRMVRRIVSNLGLPQPSKIIRVEDVATEEEIGHALRERDRRGTHALPIPTVEIRRSPLSALSRGLRAFLALARPRKGPQGAFTEGAFTPVESTRGQVAFTEAALYQMVMHCVKEHDPRLEVEKVSFSTTGRLHAIEVHLRLRFEQESAATLHALRQYILQSMEKHAGLLVSEVNVVVAAVER